MIDLGDDFFWPSTSPLFGKSPDRCLRLPSIQVNLVLWGDDSHMFGLSMDTRSCASLWRC